MLLDPNAALHQTVVGPDGFPIRPDDPLAAAQLQLGAVFQPETSGADDTHPGKLDGAGSDDHACRLLAAAIIRHSWLHRHQRLIPEWEALAVRLEILVAELAFAGLRLSPATVLPVLDAMLTASNLDHLAAAPIIESLHEYVDRRGASPALAVRIQQLYENSGMKGLTGNAARRRLAYLLWLIGPDDRRAACCTSVMQQDLDGMPAGEQRSWRRLLLCHTPVAQVKAPETWKQTARKRLLAIGAEEFAAHTRKWLTEISRQRRAPLSQAGSDVLKTLLWCCHLVPQAPIQDALLALCETDWKEQRNVRGSNAKVIHALAGNLARLESRQALPHLRRFWEHYGGRYLYAQYKKVAGRLGVPVPELREASRPPARPRAAQSAETLLRDSLRSIEGNRIHLQGDSIRIEGQQDSYQVEPGGLLISRDSDGAQLLLKEAMLPEPYGTFLKAVGPHAAGAVRTLIVIELLRTDLAGSELFETRRIQ